MKKVILIGYMGSGKSIIAEKLSQKTNIKYVELDNLIQEKTNKSINELFQTKGELYFRKIENQIFREILSDENDLIISTGGGTPCYFDNHKLLNDKNCSSIYLKASIETLYNRLLSDKANRPLLANLSSDKMKEFIAKHLFERSCFYNEAGYKISVDYKNPDEIVSEIVKLLF